MLLFLPTKSRAASSICSAKSPLAPKFLRNLSLSVIESYPRCPKPPSPSYPHICVISCSCRSTLAYSSRLTTTICLLFFIVTTFPEGRKGRSIRDWTQASGDWRAVRPLNICETTNAIPSGPTSVQLSTGLVEDPAYLFDPFAEFTVVTLTIRRLRHPTSQAKLARAHMHWLLGH